MYSLKELLEKIVKYLKGSYILPLRNDVRILKTRTINSKNIFDSNVTLKSKDIVTQLNEISNNSNSFSTNLERNSIHVVPARSGNTTFTFPSYHNNGCEYKIIYTKGSGALTLPNTITYNITPDYVTGNTYLIHIIGNYGIITQLTNNS